MSEHPSNRFAYANLIDFGFDPENPEILLELGTERPVDWDAVDEDGAVICKRLDFVLTVAHVRSAREPLGIHFTYRRVLRDFGRIGEDWVYLLALHPTRDKDGRECDRIALETVVREARTLRGRSWCADIGEIRVAWRHAPQDIIRIPNDAYAPETAAADIPQATDEELARMCDALDAFCDGIDPLSAPPLELDERDIEYVAPAPPIPRGAFALN